MNATRSPTAEDAQTEVRETYEEYELTDTMVGMISDPQNQYAWVQSDTVVPLDDAA